MTSKPKFSMETKLAELERELKMRSKVYPRMSYGQGHTFARPSEAALATDIMEDIAEDYRRALARKEKAA
jgi:hypothetical protein